eukprot:CFRG1980T1
MPPSNKRVRIDYEVPASKYKEDHNMSPRLSLQLMDKDLRNDIRSAFDAFETKIFGDDKVQISLYGSPFRIISIKNVMEDQQYTVNDSSTTLDTTTFLSHVRADLETIPHKENHNDLYYFLQSRDLKDCTLPYVSMLRNWLYADVRTLCESLTGFKLDPNTLNLFSARYPSTGRLLCHDDQLEGRAIAFIIYLSAEDWRKEEGGALEVFDTMKADTQSDHDDRPKPTSAPSLGLSPSWNTFSCFEVSKNSFHQVQEVLGERTRYSIGGWYFKANGGVIPNLQQKSIKSDAKTIPGEGSEFVVEEKRSTINLAEWINPVYLQESSKRNISDKFVEESSIQLKNFLLQDKYESVAKALKEEERLNNEDSFWTINVTPIIARYASPVGATDELTHIKNLISSTEFVDFVNAIAGLEVTKGITRVRKFAHGDFTLLPNGDTHRETECLEVSLVFSSKDKHWDAKWGGVKTYLVEGEEVISICPDANTLSLVFRSEETERFVQYIDHRAGDCSYVDVEAIYMES